MATPLMKCLLLLGLALLSAEDLHGEEALGLLEDVAQRRSLLMRYRGLAETRQPPARIPVRQIVIPPPTRSRASTGACRWDGLVLEASRTYRLPPAFIKAVIRVESGFDPRAESAAGAQGLMQLMPQTQERLGVTDPFDPRQNVLAGCRLLQEHLAHYRSVKKALIAYNAGSGYVDSGRTLPEETEQYIRKVLRAYRLYRRQP